MHPSPASQSPALTTADVRQLLASEPKCRITAEVPAALHREFMLTCAALDATASQLYRDFMRTFNATHAAECAAFLAQQHEDI